MYQVQRKNLIKEQLQLVHANGDIYATIDVDINVDRVGAQINKAFELLGMAQAAAQKDPTNPKLWDAVGQSCIALFTAVFGEDGCKTIVDFYGSRDAFTEMLVDLFPFINGEIIPKVREASAERKKQLLAMAKALR
jgi:hypothetical protein